MPNGAAGGRAERCVCGAGGGLAEHDPIADAVVVADEALLRRQVVA